MERGHEAEGPRHEYRAAILSVSDFTDLNTYRQRVNKKPYPALPLVGCTIKVQMTSKLEVHRTAHAQKYGKRAIQNSQEGCTQR